MNTKVKKAEKIFCDNKKIADKPLEVKFCDDVKISDLRKDYIGLALWNINITIPIVRVHVSYELAQNIGLGPCCRQAKTHKKKRINKKWAKRYGYVLNANLR